MTCLTVKQFADEFEYSTDTVYAMIDKHELGCIRRPGCSIRIMDTHIAVWLERFDCPAVPSNDQNPELSASMGVTIGMSDGRQSERDELASRRPAFRSRSRLKLSEPNS